MKNYLEWMTPAIRAYRQLRHDRDFVAMDVNSSNWDLVSKHPGEKPLYIFRNSLVDGGGIVIFSSNGVHILHEGNILSVPYAEIESVAGREPKEKLEARDTVLILIDGKVVKVPIRDSRGTVKPLFSGYNFLRDVVHDVQQRRLQKERAEQHVQDVQEQ